MKKFLILSIIIITNLCLAGEMGTSTLQNGGFLLLKFWREVISPVDGPRCAYRPTCSEYARQAIKKYGFTKGYVMAAERLQRCTSCHNYSVYNIKDGYAVDPVEANYHE